MMERLVVSIEKQTAAAAAALAALEPDKTADNNGLDKSNITMDCVGFP